MDMTDAQFANFLGHFYEDLEKRLGDILIEQKPTMSPDQFALLSKRQDDLIDYANKFFTLADDIGFQSSAAVIKGVSDATASVNAALKKIDNINKVIAITAGVIMLAESVVKMDGGGAIASVQSILAATKS